MIRIGEVPKTTLVQNLEYSLKHFNLCLRFVSGNKVKYYLFEEDNIKCSYSTEFGQLHISLFLN